MIKTFVGYYHWWLVSFFLIFSSWSTFTSTVPPELTHLNTMEQRLIARVQAFMKLIVLPLGQRALAGQTINFPVNVSEVCNSLPRPLNSDGIVLVKPPESDTVSVSDPRQPTTNTSNSEPSTTSVSTGANGSHTNIM